MRLWLRRLRLQLRLLLKLLKLCEGRRRRAHMGLVRRTKWHGSGELHTIWALLHVNRHCR